MSKKSGKLKVFIQYCLVSSLFTGCGTHTYHVVRPGDTLYSIGWAYGYDYKQLAKWNRIEAPYIIKGGQIIRLTPPRAQAGQSKTSISRHSTQASVEDKSAGSEGHRHLSKRNDSHEHTASRRGGDVLPRGKVTWQWPTQGRVIQNFKAGDARKQGLKIVGQSGQPIYAAAKGKVVYTGTGLIGYGQLVIVKHTETLLSAYAHNQSVKVKEGQFVEKGQHIADMGSTGTDRVMLHFEIRENGEPVNPLIFLPKRRSSL